MLLRYACLWCVLRPCAPLFFHYENIFTLYASKHRHLDIFPASREREKEIMEHNFA